MMNSPAPEQVTHKGVEFLIDRDLKVVRFLTTGVFSEMLAAVCVCWAAVRGWLIVIELVCKCDCK